MRISIEQRHAIYDHLLIRLDGLTDLQEDIQAERYEAASRLGLELSDILSFILTDLKWGRGPRANTVDLESDPALLRRVFARLEDDVAGRAETEGPEREDLRSREEQDGLVLDACRTVMGRLAV